MTTRDPARHPDRARRGSVYLGVAGGLFAVSGALVGAYFLVGGDARADGPSKRPALPGSASGAAVADVGDLAVLVEAMLEDTVEVVVADKVVPMRWSDLGVIVDDADVEHAARRAGSDEPLGSLRDAGALPVRVDRARAVAALATLKGHHDRAAIDARLDLEAREIRPEQPGFGIDVYASLGRIETAARSGAARVELVGVALPALVSRDTLGIDDISHVMGHWQTKFSMSDKDRNFNLKLAASKINGHVLAPGETFTFNGVVGNRTEKEGYKIAHVITAGEMVDGLAGGTCQISTTLFGAAFFAGLDIVDTRNHSRPSAYQPLGFDATVVWPNVDLVMKNPYEFPVAIRYVVASGVAKVEVLGKERPYDKVVFERKIIETTPFVTEERLDSTMPLDVTIHDQLGFDGYKLIRYRKLYKDGKEVRTDKWTLNYKPVTEYVRRGTNPDPFATMPEEPKHHPLKVPKDGTGRIQQ